MADQNPVASSVVGTPKKQIIRSPKYPLITISDAIDKARVIYNHDKKAGTPAQVIFNHLGHKKKTGPAGRTLSALQQYGLLDRQGINYHITDAAWKIFVLPEDSEERAELIRTAALKPSLFRELVALYRDGLPSDATLKSYLILNKGFNENTVGHFIKVFKAALAIAKQFDGKYNIDANAESEEDDFEEDENMYETPSNSQRVMDVTPPPASSTPPPSSQSSAENVYSFQLSFPRKIKAEVRIFGHDLRKQDIKRLSDEVADLAKAFDEENEGEGTLKRSAVWHNKDFEVPVVIIGAPETADDGREYIAIEGSKSKIPFDEVEETGD